MSWLTGFGAVFRGAEDDGTVDMKLLTALLLPFVV
jgi:hypothetical protein